MRVLLTGSAGFIGSAVGERLAERGHDVVGLDLLLPQAHPAEATVPAGHHRVDIRDLDGVFALLGGIDVVSHQAAMVGAGVTPADLPLYAGHNDLGTAVLLAAMAKARVSRLVLASSMVVYGDGRYSCLNHGEQSPPPRSLSDLDAGRFQLTCPHCGADIAWELVDEGAALSPRSSYAASKVAQEHYAAAWARQAPGAVIALRYHNVYGPGMPQDTPYAGVAAMFRSALERGEAPRVFEDGDQMRDFVHVSDVAEANALAIEQVASRSEDSFAALNVCSGYPISILQVAELMALGRRDTEVMPVVTGDYRAGDVRHVVASPTLASAELGFTAKVEPANGLAEFATAPLRQR
ncbi:MAG: NAD-dependent epimerase/dehydratase family protein [Nocardioidaceae bacterium]